MEPANDQGRLTFEQAAGRFRARTVSELRALNEHLPRSMRLERREVDGLVDDLLCTVAETAKRRNASLLDKTVWRLVRAVRPPNRRTSTARSMAPLDLTDGR